MNYQLLREMCATHAPSGDEEAMTSYLLQYINEQKNTWKTQPKVLSGKEFQNCIVLVFGKPTTAIFAHIDSVGFTVRYNQQLIKVGGPDIESGYKLQGTDSKGLINCILECDEERNLSYRCDREIDRGTMLTFLSEWLEEKDYIQCCSLDNRIGVFSALKVAETLQNGIICFSCWEETGGGSVAFLARYIAEQYGIKQALISDITWVTDGVFHGQGCVISMRDSGIPRRNYIQRIIDLAKKSGILFQLEVEASGGSDGNVIHHSPYPIDWCFVGAPESHAHSPHERVHKTDIESMINLYKWLMHNM